MSLSMVFKRVVDVVTESNKLKEYFLISINSALNTSVNIFNTPVLQMAYA